MLIIKVSYIDRRGYPRRYVKIQTTKPNRPPPATLKLGAGAHYTRLDMISDLLGTTVEGVHRLLGALGVPTVHFPGHGDERYVLTYALESTLFALGMPKAIKERPDMIRLHQELAGVLYGTLTKEALRERVAGLIKTLTSDAKKPKMKRVKGNQKTWAGRTPS